MSDLATQLVVGKERAGTPHGEVWWSVEGSEWVDSIFRASKFSYHNLAVGWAYTLSDADGKAYTENAMVAIKRLRNEVVS